MMDNTSYKLFKLSNSGYWCSQIMLKLALEEEGSENEDLVRAMYGMSMGMGMQRSCGVITGAVGILGIYAGKGNDFEYPKKEFSGMLKQFIKWFENEFESTECEDIIGVCSFTDYANNTEYRVKCGDILLKSYEKVKEILSENGFDFGNREYYGED